MGSPRGHSRGTHCGGSMGVGNPVHPALANSIHGPWGQMLHGRREPARRMHFQELQASGGCRHPWHPWGPGKEAHTEQRTGSLSGLSRCQPRSGHPRGLPGPWVFSFNKSLMGYEETLPSDLCTQKQWTLTGMRTED